MAYTEDQRQQLLAVQRGNTYPGEVYYERGLEIAHQSGYLYIGPTMVTVFGDAARLMAEQKTISIPYRLIIELHQDPTDL